MKVQYINNKTKRSDGRSGEPTGITLFKEYTVVTVKEDKFTILNDDFKLCNYSKSRFIVSDEEKVPDIKKAFNSLTHPMRMENKRLRELIQKQNEIIDNLNKKS